jgi:hypothetical protein
VHKLSDLLDMIFRQVKFRQFSLIVSVHARKNAFAVLFEFSVALATVVQLIAFSFCKLSMIARRASNFGSLLSSWLCPNKTLVPVHEERLRLRSDIRSLHDQLAVQKYSFMMILVYLLRLQRSSPYVPID